MDAFVRRLETMICLIAIPILFYVFYQAAVIFTREIDKVRVLTGGF